MPKVYQVNGEVIDKRTLKLDEPLPEDAAGKVRVTVEMAPAPGRRDLKEFLEEMWERQRLRGHIPRTKEEIDAYINAERDSWDF